MDAKKPTVIKLYEDGTITICPRNRRKGELTELQKIERNQKLKEIGKIKKSFVLDSKQKRIIKCSSIRMFRSKKNSIKWFTLTFPSHISQINANKCLSKFLENLKLNYYAQSYIVVKENHKSGNPHFHCLVDMPYKNFAILNNSWCKSFRDFCPYSINALTSGRNKIINDIKGAACYVTKYITKANTTDHESRIYFISENILPQPKELTFNEYIYFTTSFECRVIVKDNFTICFLKNFAYLPEMFNINIKKPAKKQEKPPKIPDSFQANLNF